MKYQAQRIQMFERAMSVPATTSNERLPAVLSMLHLQQSQYTGTDEQVAALTTGVTAAPAVAAAIAGPIVPLAPLAAVGAAAAQAVATHRLALPASAPATAVPTSSATAAAAAAAAVAAASIAAASVAAASAGTEPVAPTRAKSSRTRK